MLKQEVNEKKSKNLNIITKLSMFFNEKYTEYRINFVEFLVLKVKKSKVDRRTKWKI